MANNLVKTTAKIFGGAAVAAMGFAFGRSLYKNATSKGGRDMIGQAVAMIVICTVVILGPFMSGLWFARNYQTKFKGFIARAGAVMLMAFLLFTINDKMDSLFDEGEKTKQQKIFSRVFDDTTVINMNSAIYENVVKNLKTEQAKDSGNPYPKVWLFNDWFYVFAIALNEASYGEKIIFRTYPQIVDKGSPLMLCLHFFTNSRKINGTHPHMGNLRRLLGAG